jgi:hypothetical protein
MLCAVVSAIMYSGHLIGVFVFVLRCGTVGVWRYNKSATA